MKTGHISAIVAVLLFIICVVSMMRANNVGGGRAITMFSTSNNYGESPYYDANLYRDDIVVMFIDSLLPVN